MTEKQRVLGERIVTVIHAIIMCFMGGLVMSAAYFWTIDFGFGWRNLLIGLLFGMAVSTVLLASYYLFGVQTGWRAGVLLFITGAVGGLTIGLLSSGRLNPLWSAIIGAILLPFALFADSGFSPSRFGKQ